MSRKHRNKGSACPNCGTHLEPGFEYCPTCGQENHDLRVPFRHFAYEFIESITHFDTKVWNTLKLIFTRPGQLTKDFVEGKRARYVHPARFYVFVSFIFFALLTIWVDHGIESGHRDPARNVVRSPFTRMLPDSARAWVEQDSDFVQLLKLPIDSPLYAHTRARLVAGDLWFVDSIAESQGVDTLPGLRARLLKAARTLPDRGSLDVERLVPLFGDNYMTFPNKEEEAKFMRIGANMTDEQADSLLREGHNNEPSWFNKRMLRSIGHLQVGTIQGTQRLAHLVVKNISVIMFLLMPFTAVLLLWVFHRQRYFWEHLIFSVHIHTIFFLFFSALLLIALLLPFEVPEWVVAPVGLICLSYLLVSLRNVYGRRWVPTVLLFMVMSVPYYMVFLILLIVGFFWGMIAL